MPMMQPPLHPGDEVELQEVPSKHVVETMAVSTHSRDFSSQPPSKRLKTDDTTFPKKPWKLRAVLGDAARSPVPLVPALAAQIIDKKTNVIIN